MGSWACWGQRQPRRSRSSSCGLQLFGVWIGGTAGLCCGVPCRAVLWAMMQRRPRHLTTFIRYVVTVLHAILVESTSILRCKCKCVHSKAVQSLRQQLSIMRQLSICTYNCNSLPHVHQYTSDRSISGVLQELSAGEHTPAAAAAAAACPIPPKWSPVFPLTADIVCFQETKLAGADLWPVPFKRIAGVPGWRVLYPSAIMLKR